MSVSHPPIITFTTDFGIDDFYVAAMKGVALRQCPNATLVDITHAIPRHDVLFGSVMLERRCTRSHPARFTSRSSIRASEPAAGSSSLAGRMTDGDLP